MIEQADVEASRSDEREQMHNLTYLHREVGLQLRLHELYLAPVTVLSLTLKLLRRVVGQLAT